jgi:hypothetical protein
MTTSRQLALLCAASTLLAGCSATTGGPTPSRSAPAPSTSPAARGIPGTIPKSWGQFMVQCMSDKGWRVTRAADDQIDAESVPESQRGRYQQDFDACGAIHAAAFPPSKLTEASVKGLYAEELATAKCLQGLGIAVDPPMSEQSYVDAYLSGKAPAWSSYANVGSQTRLTTDEVQKKCPQPRAR